MTISLTREFRFYWTGSPLPDRSSNSWGGWNNSLSLSPYLRLRLTVVGTVSQPVGYLCNIRELDRVMKQVIDLATASSQIAPASLPELFSTFLDLIPANLPFDLEWQSLCLCPSPQMSLTAHRKEPGMIVFTQQFEFSAAHRLHCPELSDQKNWELFGKCNNPAGHGHNYVLEVSLIGNPDPIPMQQIQDTVKSTIIDQFDHKHLNHDVAEFKQLNPSVENIAHVIFSKLNGQFGTCKLQRVRVYETPKTWADCDSTI